MDNTRRKLVKLAFSIPFSGFIAKSVLAKSPTKLYLMNKFIVAGFQFYDGPQLLGKLHVNNKLNLIAEPENPHDKYAVKILYHSKMIGHVPRRNNQHISRLLRQNIKLKCRIAEVNREQVPWKMLKVEVYLVG